MRGWDGLVSSALLGTERRPPNFEELPPPIQQQLSGEPGLLDAAALATLYKRAGRLPLRGVEPLPVAEGEDRPLPRPNAIRRLTAMLTGFQSAALGEWLRIAEAKGWGIPPEHLPALADYARGRAEYRPLVVAAAGRRAAWLAGLNPEWRFLHEAVGEDPELWTHGNSIQRRAWFRALRQRDPGAALDALGEVWPTEPASARAEFLGVLKTNLSGADEDLLEQALDDKAKDVRRVAAGLLARIDGSRYGVRMAERVSTYLVQSQGVLAVTLPERVSKAMERDGIDAQAHPGLGRRAWWLRQIVAAAPLPAPGILQLPVEGIAAEVLQAAWAEAAVREQNVEWARALLRHNAATDNRTSELLRVLPPDELPAAIEHLRARIDLSDLVGGLPVPWSASVAELVLDQLVKVGTARNWARLAGIAARAVPPEALNHPITREPTGEEDTWRSRLVETLVFRREMYEELS
ncbi:hypothetical protein Kfla_0709 [Kribbella flavida DSM 17836]|uniref:Uncharacterized protein n=1 Tax=Kribbella flavida (strain DSM 17836 / JCM 10339 / NBRC 14399) TaxID=479435 RepID=D2PYI4_KRIFD|nr:DUF5691 domain-containing protein [Kribbella flavida]ADB29830.1 hypothetical protein Kfla_0709 [Kribbella flavida DSM 17836]